MRDECVSLEKASRDAPKNRDGIYEVHITQQKYLGRGPSREYECSPGRIFWHVVMPPVSMDVNTSSYQAHHRVNDISWIGQPPQKLFQGTNPVALKSNLALGHVILANPFSSSISTKLNLTKALNLKIRDQSYPVHQNFLAIKYFSYNLLKDEVGEEK